VYIILSFGSFDFDLHERDISTTCFLKKKLNLDYVSYVNLEYLLKRTSESLFLLLC
jgi:hypothetical protein